MDTNHTNSATTAHKEHSSEAIGFVDSPARSDTTAAAAMHDTSQAAPESNEKKTRASVGDGGREENAESENINALLLAELLQELRKMNERQAKADDVLRQINHRQATSEISRKPIPSVPASSSSAWNSLLSSALSRINPILDGWRESVDVLLVFIGLFSAVVTSFLVDSLLRLSPDQTARTNEILANLTEIVIQLSGVQSGQLNIISPSPFVPDAADVRINVYWSLALVISISTAALAVAGRGYLSIVSKSSNTPHAKLLVIYQTWEHAQAILGPALESLPAVLTISVLLFLVGLLENILSVAFQSSRVLGPVAAAASLSAATILAVGVSLVYTVFHAHLHPETSPFRTSISPFIDPLPRHVRSVVRALPDRIRVSFHRIQTLVQNRIVHHDSLPHHIQSVIRAHGPHEHFRRIMDFLYLHLKNRSQPGDNDQFLPLSDRVYHTILQVTHDDDLLDRAAAAFARICENTSTRISFYNNAPSGTETTLSSLETKSLIHLLSPEATYRCNLTAAESIIRLYLNPPVDAELPFCSEHEIYNLLDKLFDASRRDLDQKNSIDLFIRAFTALVHPENQPVGNDALPSPYIFELLNSKYISFPEASSSAKNTIIELAFSTLWQRYRIIHDTVTASTEYSTISSVARIQSVDRSISSLLGSREKDPSVLSVTATQFLCLWTQAGLDIPIQNAADLKDFIAGLVRWIWSEYPPTTKDFGIVTSWVLAFEKIDSNALTWTSLAAISVFEETICCLEANRNWQDFNTYALGLLAYPGLRQKLLTSAQDHQVSAPPALMNTVAYLGAYLRFFGDDYEPYTITFHYAFSVLAEKIFQQCRTRSIEKLPDHDIDVAFCCVLGARHQGENASIKSFDVEVCLSAWDGRNIFTKGAIETDSWKSLIAATIRWLWSDESITDNDIPEQIRRLTNTLVSKEYRNRYQYLVEVLIGLIRFEYSRTQSLDLAFNLIRELTTQPEKHLYNCFPLAADLIRLITTHTGQHHASLSAEQASVVDEYYEWVTLVDDLNDYSWEYPDKAEVEKTQIVASLRKSFGSSTLIRPREAQ